VIENQPVENCFIPIFSVGSGVAIPYGLQQPERDEQLRQEDASR